MDFSLVLGNSEWWLSLSSSLIGALTGGVLTFLIGSVHLSKQLKENKESRKTDYIIRKLEYNRNQLLELKKETRINYNKIYHEAEYREMIKEEKNLVYDEKTNVVLFKDMLVLLSNYQRLEETQQDNTKTINRISRELTNLMDGEFYSKVKTLNTYELKIHKLKGEVNIDSSEYITTMILLLNEGLKLLQQFEKILDEDLDYIKGRLIYEESNL